MQPEINILPIHFSVPLINKKCWDFRWGLALLNHSSLCAILLSSAATIFDGGVPVVIFTLLYLGKLSHNVMQCVVCICAFLLGKLPYWHNEHMLCLLYTNASAWPVCLYLLNFKSIFKKWVFELSIKGNMHFEFRGEKNFMKCQGFQIIEAVLSSKTVWSCR